MPRVKEMALCNSECDSYVEKLYFRVPPSALNP